MVQLGLFCLEWPLCNTLPGLLSELPPPRTLAPGPFALGSAFNPDKGRRQRVGQRDELGSECHTLRAHGLATGGEPVPQPSTSAELIPHPHHPVFTLLAGVPRQEVAAKAEARARTMV